MWKRVNNLNRRLPFVPENHSVRVFMSPPPILAPLSVFDSVPFPIFAIAFYQIAAIGPVFTVIPLMVIAVCRIVVLASVAMLGIVVIS